jgi:ATP-dependent DNA helicase RecG
MKENQRLEWKQTWRDKFIRWICGFANAEGGVLHIGRIWNPCVFPDAWTVKTLLGAHPSTPFNPAIANVFFRSGEIEMWGRGIERIVAACTEAGSPKPKLIVDGTGIAFELRYTPEYLKAVNALDPVTEPGRSEGTPEVAGKVAGQVTEQVERLLVMLAAQTLRREEMQSRLDLQSLANFRDRYLMPALAAGLIERTLPDKPNSRLQKYRLTAGGRAWLARHPSPAP